MEAPTELSMFTGAGGGELAAQHLIGFRTVCYVEWNRYCIDILKARIADRLLDDAPIWDDANTFDGRPWAGLVDSLSAGFPCQPYSVAGKGLAENDPRDGWPATIRTIRAVRPRIVRLENVPGLLSKPYFRRILGDLAEAGYMFEHDCISAQEIGANHRRERLWIVAYTHSPANGVQYTLEEIRRYCNEKVSNVPHAQGGDWNVPAVTDDRQEALYAVGDGPAWPLAIPNSGRQEREPQAIDESQKSGLGTDSVRGGGEGGDEIKGIPLSGGQWETERRDEGLRTPAEDEGLRGDLGGGAAEYVRGEWWQTEPLVGRVADGVAHRVDRLEALGNGQVPEVVREAWHRLFPEEGSQ